MGRQALTGALVALLLGGCFPVVQQVHEGPAQPVGPQLAVEVTNRSGNPVEVGYEFESAGMSGGGTGSVGRCERALLLYGETTGRLRISVDGAEIDDAAVQQGLQPDLYLVLSVEIGADGSAEITGRRIAPEVREPAQPAIPDCG